MYIYIYIYIIYILPVFEINLSIRIDDSKGIFK